MARVVPTARCPFPQASSVMESLVLDGVTLPIADLTGRSGATAVRLPKQNVTADHLLLIVSCMAANAKLTVSIRRHLEWAHPRSVRKLEIRHMRYTAHVQSLDLNGNELFVHGDHGFNELCQLLSTTTTLTGVLLDHISVV
jgi:hypothetical protein